MQLIPDIKSAWIAYKEQVVNAYAYSDRINLEGNQLQLTFPYHPAKCEELNCLVLGFDYQIEANHPLKILFRTKVKRSPFTINNHLNLPYTIDRSPQARPILVYTETEEIAEIEEAIPLTRNQVRFISDEQVECSSNLIGKEVLISCSVLIKRWVQDFKHQINTPITFYLASEIEIQVGEGQLKVFPHADLHAPTRTLTLDEIREIKRELL